MAPEPGDGPERDPGRAGPDDEGTDDEGPDGEGLAIEGTCEVVPADVS